MNGVRIACMLIAVAVGLPACSSKQAYEGLQAGQRAQCVKLPEPDRSRCLESASLRYEDYEAQRGK